jgi:hypothetical protein
MGLSGHLQHNALGHFETFHKAMMEGFQALLGQSNVKFLGLQKSNNEEYWFDPLIPSSLTSTISWLPRKFLNSLGADLDIKKEVRIIYVYEGNLSNLFLFGRVARRSKGVYLYFNLFNSHKYSSVLNSPIKFLLFRLLFKLASRGADEKICLVADTSSFSAFLSSKLGRNFLAFPMYSGLNLSLPKIGARKINLINVRGLRAERLFRQAVDNEPNLSKIPMEVHGMLNDEIKLYLTKYPNITVSNGHVDEYSYFTSYSKYSSVAFLYDPDFFSMQSSGRLADAVVSGARLLVPKGTSLEEVLMEYGNGTSFDFEDDASLALALLSKPCISRTAKELPTNYWAATKILHSVKALIEKSEQKREIKVTKILNFALDEAIWVSLWVLRFVFGLRRRVATLITLKAGRRHLKVI